MRLLRILAVSFLFAACLNAQTIRGSIYGRVLDPTGSPIAAAKVVAIHVATSTESRYETDGLGQYDFPRLLQFGKYRLEVEAPGFQRLIRDGIDLIIDQR